MSGTESSVENDPNAPIRFMQQVISLDYVVRTSPINRYFGRKLREGQIVGHKCPSCGLVFVPPRGYCPICVVATSEADEVEISDQGIVTSWTVLTPIQYHGQTERDDYALASILLDGADGTIGQQRLVDVPLDEIVDVADRGVVKEWAWVEEPLRFHPLDRPFAWALIQIDGADTSMLHALDAGSADQVASGLRVQARWRAERRGHVTDIECFEPEATR